MNATHGPPLRAIGTMSGTSMDGVDIALIETDGERIVRRGPAGFRAYDDADRSLLRAALAEAGRISSRDARPPAVANAERMITRRHSEAVQGFLHEHRIAPDSVDVLGFHGQTVLHRPAEKLTIQIGDGAALASSLGIATAFDLRAADVAAGGQGAPLVPAYHRALVVASNLANPVALVNIGGVANITWIDGDCDPIAFDTGPGNALLDDLMLVRTGEPLDRDGATAARGSVDAKALDAMLMHPFFALPPPKSLDRNAFSAFAVEGLATADAAATLTAFTAETIVRSFTHYPSMPKHLVVCGGGARNPTLLRELSRRATCDVTTADAIGWSADAMEAQAFAYLAVRCLRGLPLTFPTTTGVPHAMTGGRIARISRAA